MKIPDQVKPYLASLFALLGIVYFLYDTSTNKFTCDKWANNFRDDAQFNLVLTKTKNEYSRDAYLYGVDPDNGRKIEFEDGGGWLPRIINKFQIGDTLVKKRGKYAVTIKRKGAVFQIPFECDKIYEDK